MRQGILAIPLAQLREMRRVNKITNYVATQALHSQGSEVRPFVSGKEVKRFLRRMDMRLEDQITFSSFQFRIDDISLAAIRRFGVEMEDRVRKLTIDFSSSPLPPPPQPISWKQCWAGWRSPPDKETRRGVHKEKVIQLLSALFRNLEELHMIFQNGGWETLNDADLRRLPNSFPRLRRFTFQHISLHHFNVNQPETEGEQEFFSYIFRTAPKMELVTIASLPVLMPRFQKWTTLVAELGRRPFPVSLELCLYPGQQFAHATFLRDLIRIGYKDLRSLIIFTGPSETAHLINTFLNLQRNSLEMLKIWVHIGGVISEERRHEELVLPILPKLKSLHFAGKSHLIFPPFKVDKLFPKLEEVTLSPENFPKMHSWFSNDTRITVDHEITT